MNAFLTAWGQPVIQGARTFEWHRPLCGEFGGLRGRRTAGRRDQAWKKPVLRGDPIDLDQCALQHEASIGVGSAAN